ncbi:hypothetical protein L0Y46_01030 [bacterium]|nr:hypothetical protein [bacterium]
MTGNPKAIKKKIHDLQQRVFEIDDRIGSLRESRARLNSAIETLQAECSHLDKAPGIFHGKKYKFCRTCGKEPLS